MTIEPDSDNPGFKRITFLVDRKTKRWWLAELKRVKKLLKKQA